MRLCDTGRLVFLGSEWMPVGDHFSADRWVPNNSGELAPCGKTHTNVNGNVWVGGQIICRVRLKQRMSYKSAQFSESVLVLMRDRAPASYGRPLQYDMMLHDGRIMTGGSRSVSGVCTYLEEYSSMKVLYVDRHANYERRQRLMSLLHIYLYR